MPTGDAGSGWWSGSRLSGKGKQPHLRSDYQLLLPQSSQLCQIHRWACYIIASTVVAAITVTGRHCPPVIRWSWIEMEYDKFGLLCERFARFNAHFSAPIVVGVDLLLCHQTVRHRLLATSTRASTRTLTGMITASPVCTCFIVSGRK